MSYTIWNVYYSPSHKILFILTTNYTHIWHVYTSSLPTFKYLVYYANHYVGIDLLCNTFLSLCF